VQEISNARDAANRAVVLGPSLVAAHAAIGEIRLDYDWDWAGADGAYQRALALEKGNAQIVERAASLAATLNRFEDALFFPAEPSTLTRFFRQRTTFSPSMLGGVGLDESDTASRKGLEIDPQFPPAGTRIQPGSPL
jgi:hypothetical protein